MRFFKEIVRGLWKENPIFRLVLGMCPTLATTTSLENSLGMGMAATFVLICSNMAISMVRNVIPSKVRIPCYIVIIASFVTVVDLLMNAFAPKLYESLGLFIPLIVVNCIILGRAEAFASKNSVLMSMADGIGMGLGFTLSLAILGTFREIVGAGTITVWGSLKMVVNSGSEPMLLLILAPGGFMTLGTLLALMNNVQNRLSLRKGKGFVTPATLDCRHCTLCKWGE